jgi:hypothetical protein
MENKTNEDSFSEKKPWGKLSPIEKKVIFRNLQKILGTDEVDVLGYYRFKTSKKERITVGDSFTKLTRDTLYNENGEQIPTNAQYHNIFSFYKGVANVCIRNNIQFIETESGTHFTQDRKDGLIDVNGKEVLPCIFDSIHVQGDGFVEIKKNGQCKITNVDIIMNGNFDWDKAEPCNL